MPVRHYYLFGLGNENMKIFKPVNLNKGDSMFTCSSIAFWNIQELIFIYALTNATKPQIGTDFIFPRTKHKTWNAKAICFFLSPYSNTVIATDTFDDIVQCLLWAICYLFMTFCLLFSIFAFPTQKKILMPSVFCIWLNLQRWKVLSLFSHSLCPPQPVK